LHPHGTAATQLANSLLWDEQPCARAAPDFLGWHFAWTNDQLPTCPEAVTRVAPLSHHETKSWSIVAARHHRCRRTKLVATTRRRVTSVCGLRRCSLQTQPSPVAPGNRLRLHPRAPAEAQIRLLLRVRSEQPQQARLTSGTAIDVCSRSFWPGLHFSLHTLGRLLYARSSLTSLQPH
jgi:hypothetical protein